MDRIPITKARDCLGKILNRVVFGRERIILERRNEKMALISMEDLAALEALEDSRDIQLADAARKDIEANGTVSWENIKKELNLCNTQSNSLAQQKKTSKKSPENS